MTGKDIIVILSQGGTALASTSIRSQDIQTSCATIEKASSTQQDWEEHIAGRKSWNLTVNYLVLSSAKVNDLLYVGQTFDIKMNIGETTYLVGKAIMNQVKQTATIGNLVQGSFSLKGSGPLAAPTT